MLTSYQIFFIGFYIYILKVSHSFFSEITKENKVEKSFIQKEYYFD